MIFEKKKQLSLSCFFSINYLSLKYYDEKIYYINKYNFLMGFDSHRNIVIVFGVHKILFVSVHNPNHSDDDFQSDKTEKGR